MQILKEHAVYQEKKLTQTVNTKIDPNKVPDFKDKGYFGAKSSSLLSWEKHQAGLRLLLSYTQLHTTCKIEYVQLCRLSVQRWKRRGASPQEAWEQGALSTHAMQAAVLS